MHDLLVDQNAFNGAKKSGLFTHALDEAIAYFVPYNDMIHSSEVVEYLREMRTKYIGD